MDTYERLNEIFRNVFDDDSLVVNSETSADTIEGWDSIAHINLMVAVEQEFGVQFSSAELSSFENVGELVECLERKGVR